MALAVKCPHCHKKGSVPDAAEGRPVKCPSCGNNLNAHHWHFRLVSLVRPRPMAVTKPALPKHVRSIQSRRMKDQLSEDRVIYPPPELTEIRARGHTFLDPSRLFEKNPQIVASSMREPIDPFICQSADAADFAARA